MHAAVRRYQGLTTLADELAARADEIEAEISGIPGFVAYYLVRAGDGAVSISVYEDESGAEASTRAAAAWLHEHMPDVAASPPAISAGEVVVCASAR
jgi:heme-degrading monooxygenase HmoA